MLCIAELTSDKLNHQISCRGRVYDLDQRLIKTRQEMCDMIIEVQPACEGNDSTLVKRLISNIELVSDLMQRTVDTLFKTHRENNAFNTNSELKSMYQPFITKQAHFALHRLKN